MQFLNDLVQQQHESDPKITLLKLDYSNNTLKQKNPH